MDLTHNIIEYVNCCVGAFAVIVFALHLRSLMPICEDFKA